MESDAGACKSGIPMAKDKSKMGTAEMCFLFCESNCCSAVADTELPPPASQLQAVTSPLGPHCSSNLHGFSNLLPSPALGLLSIRTQLAISYSSPYSDIRLLISSAAHSKRPLRTHPAAPVCSSCRRLRHGYARSHRARRPGSRRCSGPSRRLCRC